MTFNKLRHSLIESKRDGQAVLDSLTGTLLYENSASRANGLVIQIALIPKLIRQLEESPGTMIQDFETIRSHCEFRNVRQSFIVLIRPNNYTSG